QQQRSLHRFYLNNISLGTTATNLLGKVNIHTLLLSQVLSAVPHPEFLSLMPEVFVRYCFDPALFLILGQADLLKSLIDIKAEVAIFVVMLSPPGYEFPFCILRLGRDPNERLREKLKHVVLDRLFPRVSCPN